MVGGIYLGYYRGLILEIGDFVVGLGASLVGFRIFRGLGGALKGSLLSKWDTWWVNECSFYVLFLPTFILLITAVLQLDRVTKEQDRIPPEIRKYGGGFIGTFKTLTVACLFIGWMGGSGLMTEAETKGFHNAGFVRMIKGFSAPTQILVRLACPNDIADRFIAVMTR